MGLIQYQHPLALSWHTPGDESLKDHARSISSTAHTSRGQGHVTLLITEISPKSNVHICGMLQAFAVTALTRSHAVMYAGAQPMTGQPGVTQSLQTAQPNLFVLPACRYMLPVGATCGGPGSVRACSGQRCLPGQFAGGCCVPGSECRQAHQKCHASA